MQIRHGKTDRIMFCSFATPYQAVTTIDFQDWAMNTEIPAVVDHTIPEGKWQFNEGVTKVFDDMLSRSIPEYQVMRQLVFDLA